MTGFRAWLKAKLYTPRKTLLQALLVLVVLAYLSQHLSCDCYLCGGMTAGGERVTDVRLEMRWQSGYYTEFTDEYRLVDLWHVRGISGSGTGVGDRWNQWDHCYVGDWCLWNKTTDRGLVED